MDENTKRLLIMKIQTRDKLATDHPKAPQCIDGTRHTYDQALQKYIPMVKQIEDSCSKCSIVRRSGANNLGSDAIYFKDGTIIPRCL